MHDYHAWGRARRRNESDRTRWRREYDARVSNDGAGPYSSEPHHDMESLRAWHARIKAESTAALRYIESRMDMRRAEYGPDA